MVAVEVVFLLEVTVGAIDLEIVGETGGVTGGVTDGANLQMTPTNALSGL